MTEFNTPTVASRSAARPGANFWRLWSANGLSNLGDGIYQFGLPLLAVSLTSSPAGVAGVSVALSLAWPLFALHAGSIVDASDRRRLMLVVNLARLAVLALLTLAVLMDRASLPLLYLAVLVLGLGETLMDTALTAIVPATVARERLGWANARITAGQTVSNSFVGPPLAGALAGLSLALTTGVATLLYAAASLALLSLRGAYHVPALITPGVRRRGQLTAGLRFLWRVPLVRDLTLLTAAMNVFWGGWTAVLVLYAVAPGPMNLSAFGYGLLLTAMGVGGVLGALLAERLEHLLGTRRALLLDVIGTIALLGVPALTAWPFAVGAAAFFAGMGASLWVVLVATIRQRLVPDALLGRVYSASRLLSWGVGPLGAILAGLVAQFWGVRTYFMLASLVALVLVPIFLRTVTPRALARAKTALPAHETSSQEEEASNECGV